MDIPNFIIGGSKGANDIISESLIDFDDKNILASADAINDYSDNTIFYDQPRAQIDNGAECTVTNLLHLLQKVTFYDKKHRCNVKMKGSTSKDTIVPEAMGLLRVKANCVEGFVDIHCYY